MSTSNPRGASVVIVSVVFVILAAICISMRLYARLIVLKNSGYDELAISASFVSLPALPRFPFWLEPRLISLSGLLDCSPDPDSRT
jgi:hypothetical protein